MQRSWRSWVGMAVVAVVAGCGGGGGGADEPPPAPAWRPAADDTWNWQLSGPLDTGVDARVYDIDLFEVPASTIARLQADGRRVVCYFSAGSAEDWRPDHAAFAAADLGAPLDGWPGERWVDTRSANVRDIVRTRLDLAVEKGCDGVEPDNMDAYDNAPGFPLTAATQLDFNRFVAAEARRRGLAVGLKNDVAQLEALEPHFDFAVNEECHEHGECAAYRVFRGAGKAVFNAEYRQDWVDDATARADLCARARAAGLRTLVLPLALDGSFRFSCD